MLVLAPNQKVEKYPYTLGDLRKSNPNTSFPKNPSDDQLAPFNVFRVQRVEQPSFNQLTENLLEKNPVVIDGQWTQVFEVVPASPEEIAERKINAKRTLEERRVEDYRRFADPLYFKWQRGEATQEEWLEAVRLVKEQHPYVE